MDVKEQAAGEKNVREFLVDPLLRRGLAKPSGLKNEMFEAMLRDLCQRLAYMTPANLAALEEHSATRPSGRDRDRFPIANDILVWAADIQRPDDTASPLIRAVFADQLGRDAIAENWAAELLIYLRENRRWPKPFSLKSVREDAAKAVDRSRRIEARIAAGEFVGEVDQQFLRRRSAAMDRCREIAALAGGEKQEQAG